ncbi:MAG: ribonuclease III [Rickettsia sp.]|nr:ribonuclease III [Rickettsia sp.]
MIENRINYIFKNKELLKEALTHPSLNKKSSQRFFDYERLELLGDSILSFVITDILLKNFPDLQEGDIVKMKSVLVSRDILCKISLDLDINSYILMSKGEETIGGRNNLNNLSNVVEALIGAIYLDSDMSCIYRVIKILWQNYLNNIDIVSSDPKTFLQEWAQSYNYGIPKYKMINKSGEVHAPIFTIKVSLVKKFSVANGKSIKQAEKNAALKFITSFISQK